jgi:type VI secretion system Hcp family effector
MRVISCIAFFVAVALAPAAFAQQPTFFVYAEGSAQGPLEGDSQAIGRVRHIEGLQFHHDLRTDIDPVAGRLNGPYEFAPLTFVKATDPSTPQWHQAAITAERLNPVTFTFYRIDSTLGEVPYYRITLTDAYVDEVRQWAPSADSQRGRESISLTFGTIKWEFIAPDGSTLTEATADWAPSALP